METALERVLQLLDERPTVAAYAKAARGIKQFSAQLRPVRVAILATFTVDLLVPYLEVEAARGGFAADIYLGPFNSVRQELLSPTSGCVAHQPDIVFLAQHLSDICPTLVSNYLVLDSTRIEQYIEETLSESMATVREFRKLSNAAVIVQNFSLPPHPLLGIYEVMATESQTQAIRRLNERLVDVAKDVPGVYVLDYDRLCAEIGFRNWCADKMWYLGRSPLSAQAMMALSRVQAAFLRAIMGSPYKCLVLDLDNVLWGGVIGEDGIDRIKLGYSYPGNVFRHFQQVVLQLHQQGVILAVNSKNNLADIEEVFKSHPDMVLRWEHFASTRINWRDKPENMMEIAEELNIGLESLVFFDDNPVERAMMHQALPQVLTLEVPTDPLKYVQALLDCRAFDKLSFTDEDRRRGAMYREQTERRSLERSTTSLQEFFGSLETTVTIRPVDDFSFPRVMELIQKTNQFNLTTRRYLAAQLKEMIGSPAFGAFCLRVADRFGDNGIVGAAVMHTQRTTARLDTFLLSCRVLGRAVETAFLSFLVDWAKSRGAESIEAEFVSTAKNTPAADFLPRHGFKQIGVNDGSTMWRLELKDIPFHWPNFIHLVD